MIFDNLPEEAKQKAMDYYGISSYPPADGSCKWKLICGTRRNEKNYSYAITNGCTAAIYMVTMSAHLDMKLCEESDFNSPEKQIILADMKEVMIFGRFDKFLYKLIPCEHMKDAHTLVSPLRAKVFVRDDFKHLEREDERLKELTQGKVVAAALDKDLCKDIVFPVFHIITSYMKHMWCDEYTISWTLENKAIFCETTANSNTFFISRYVNGFTVEQLHGLISGKNVGDVLNISNHFLHYDALFHQTRRRGPWGWHTGQAYANLVGVLEKKIKSDAGRQVYYTEKIHSHSDVVTSGGKYYSRFFIFGYRTIFNDFNKRQEQELRLYDNVLNDLGLLPPKPFEVDVNQEAPITE